MSSPSKPGSPPVTFTSIQSGASVDGDCGSDPHKTPKWLDKEKFRRGQEFFEKNTFGITLSMHFSLVSGFAIINLLDPLVFTNQSNTPKKALKRYLSTFQHILLWCTDRQLWDVINEDDGNTKSKCKRSPGFESTQKVRKMHTHVARAMNKKLGDKMYVSQYDMALVQSGFMGAIVMYPANFGVSCTVAELDSYIHLWRGIGYLLGIDDMYNICSGNFQQTYDIVKAIETELLVPALQNRPEHFDLMSNAYTDGVNQGRLHLSSRDTMLALSYEAVGLPVPRLSLADTIRFYLFKFVVFVLFWFPFIHHFMNNNTKSLMEFVQKEMERQNASNEEHS